MKSPYQMAMEVYETATRMARPLSETDAIDFAESLIEQLKEYVVGIREDIKCRERREQD